MTNVFDLKFFWTQDFYGPKILLDIQFLLDTYLIQPFLLPTSNLTNQTFNPNLKTCQAKDIRHYLVKGH